MNKNTILSRIGSHVIGPAVAFCLCALALSAAPVQAKQLDPRGGQASVLALVGHTISGNVGTGGVKLSYTDGILKTVTSQPNGDYALTVSNNWTGDVTPSHACYTFNPTSTHYDNVTVNQTNQNYTPTPSGQVCVSSITRAGTTNPTNAVTVDFTVTFTESVTGVDKTDFLLTKTGVTGILILTVTGSGDTYTVTVKTGSGNGTIRLDLVDNDSIKNAGNNPLGGVGNGNGSFNSGEVYSIVKSAPKPSIPMLLSPANGTLLTSLNPTLVWKPSTPTPYRYELQVSTNNTFTNLVIDKTDLTTVSYTELAFSLDPGKLFYWRVRAFNVIDGTRGWSAVRNFKTPLAAPDLVTPTAGESLLTDRPSFDWDPVAGATQYNIQVSAASNFGSQLVNSIVTTTDYTMTKDLPQNKTLFWRVRGKNALVLGTWSANRSFTTGNPPAVPVLVSPANNMLVTDYTPLFNWNNVISPAGTSFKYYEIQADDNIDFSSPEVNATTTLNDPTNSEYQQGSDLASNTKFYWRVRAFNTDDHYSGWSTVWYLRMAILPPQNITKVDNPDPTKPLKPSFTWDPATGPGTISNYTIQISTVSNFSSLLVNATTINPSYSLINNLPAGKTIYWRVRVNGPNGPSAWSTASFTTP
jgi:hypothetical protein